jgi:hypothetical protein
VYLKIVVADRETATFFYSADGAAWTQLGSSVFFGNGGTPYIGWICQQWSAGTLGFFAVQNGAAATKNADFDWFRSPVATTSVNPVNFQKNNSTNDRYVITNANGGLMKSGIIEFTVPGVSKVSFTLFNSVGKTVGTIFTDALPGKNEVDGSKIFKNCARGIYLLSLRADGVSKTAQTIMAGY